MVKFGNRRRKLHAVHPSHQPPTSLFIWCFVANMWCGQCWDTYIPDKIVDLLHPPVFPTWTNQLEARIKQSPETFLSSPNEWIGCVNESKIEECATDWAKESNKHTCSYVYGPNYDPRVDLAGVYLDGATPIVETQVAKGMLY